MVTGGKLLFVTIYYAERVKAFSPARSREIRTLMPGAPSATRFGQLTETLTVSGMRKAKR
jgi:hypothetical protein